MRQVEGVLSIMVNLLLSAVPFAMLMDKLDLCVGKQLRFVNDILELHLY